MFECRRRANDNSGRPLDNRRAWSHLSSYGRAFVILPGDVVWSRLHGSSPASHSRWRWAAAVQRQLTRDAVCQLQVVRRTSGCCCCSLHLAAPWAHANPTGSHNRAPSFYGPNITRNWRDRLAQLEGPSGPLDNQLICELIRHAAEREK